MAKCANCGKITTFGHNRSFSQRATKRTFKPNLQKVTAVIDGKVGRYQISTKAMRMGLVVKPLKRKYAYRTPVAAEAVAE